MPIVIPNEASAGEATRLRTALAGSHVRLFKTGFTPNKTTTLEMLGEQQVDFSGYVSGGIAVTNFTLVATDPQGGSSINSGEVSWFFTPPEGEPAAVDTIGGWYLVTSTSVLIAAGTFDSPIPMQAEGDSCQFIVKIRVP